MVAGDDKQFNKFVTQYVSLLDIEYTQAHGGNNDKAFNKGEQQIDSKSNRDGGVNSTHNSSGFIIDRSKLDIRVFLLPQNESTLAHYLAMYDDLYCHNIYNFFNSNSFLSLSLASHFDKAGDQNDKGPKLEMSNGLLKDLDYQSLIG